MPASPREIRPEATEAELVYALAELSWIEAKRLDHWRKPQAIDRFLDAAAYAYDYLFDDDPVLAEGRGPSDPRFRLAMEIYNAGVDRLIRAAQTKGQIQPQNGEAIPFKVHGREQSLRIVLKDSPWNPADVHKILLASDFEVSGINRDLSQYGLGVPLIAVRETEIKKGERPPQERFYPAEMAFPLTAFLVPNSRLSDPNVDINEARECTLWLFDPVQRPRRRQEAQPARTRDRPDDAAGLHVVADRSRSLPLDGPAPPRTGPRAGQPALDPSLRAGQDPGRHGPRPDLHAAGLDPDAQRAAPRPGDPGASISSCSTCTRPACRSRSPRPACASRWFRPSRCTTRTAATRRSTRWSCWGTAWAGS